MPFRIEQPICTLDFTVDGVVMAHQPFSIRVVTPEANIIRTVAGRWLGAVRVGRRVVIQWGEDFCSAAALDEARGIFGVTNPAHTITWNEPDGSIISLDVVSENVRSRFQQDSPGFYDPLIITAWERP